MNGGVCTDGIDAYTCTCAAGYTGENCEESTFKYLYQHYWVLKIPLMFCVYAYFGKG